MFKFYMTQEPLEIKTQRNRETCTHLCLGSMKGGELWGSMTGQRGCALMVTTWESLAKLIC
jgi:hypothetical protein